MASGLIKKTTVVGVAEEVTEGTWVTPSAWLLPTDALAASPEQELLNRAILTGTITNPTPRQGKESMSVTLPLEYKASGTEGAVPESNLLVKSMLGGSRAIATQTTTKSSGNTGTTLEIEDADISKFTVGDFVVVLESGEYVRTFVTAVDSTPGSAQITVEPGKAAGSFSNSVVISKSQTYYTANSGHTSLSASIYWGDEILEKAAGCRVASMSLDNYTAGQLALMNFTLDGISFDRSDASSSGASFSTALPPVLQKACIYQDGTAIEAGNLGLTIANTVAEKNLLCDANTTAGQVITLREVTGAIDPLMDDTSVAQFTKFDATTEFSLVITAGIPSSTAGEFTLGSCIGIYLPQCVFTSAPVADVDGILTEALEFQATGGSAGTSSQVFIGFV